MKHYIIVYLFNLAICIAGCQSGSNEQNVLIQNKTIQSDLDKIGVILTHEEQEKVNDYYNTVIKYGGTWLGIDNKEVLKEILSTDINELESMFRDFELSNEFNQLRSNLSVQLVQDIKSANSEAEIIALKEHYRQDLESLYHDLKQKR